MARRKHLRHERVLPECCGDCLHAITAHYLSYNMRSRRMPPVEHRRINLCSLSVKRRGLGSPKRERAQGCDRAHNGATG